MSATVNSPSAKASRGQQSDATEGGLTTPNRRDAAATAHLQQRHNQRQKTSASGQQNYSEQNYSQHERFSGAPVTDQENVFAAAAAAAAAEDESQDSAQPLSSVRQRKKRGKPPNPHHRKEQAASGIPALDGTISPDSRSSSHTPASQATHGTPSKQAYAGPTFHASPAASALPIPKFLSRSVPSGRPQSSLQAQLDDDVGISDSSAANNDGEGRDLAAQRPRPTRQESPLDFFFNAHRAEQARHGSSDGLASMNTRSQQSLTPASAERMQHASSSRPSSRYREINRSQSGTPSEKAMFMMELDGTGDSEGSEDGRAPPLSFRDRLGASKSTSSLSQTHSSQDLEEEERLAKSQALKRLLMKEQGSNPQHSQAVDTAHSGSNWPHSFHRPAPSVQPHELSASLPPAGENGGGQQMPRPSGRSPDVQAMENNLRRILKLDS